MNEKFRVYDKIRIFNDDPDIYNKQTKLKTVFYMGQIVRGRIEKTNYESQYFTIESLREDAGNIITISKGSNAPANTFYYSRDDGATWTSSNDTTTLVLQPGKKVILKAEADIWGYHPYTNISNSWRILGDRFKVYGNIMSLIYGDNFIGKTTLPSSNLGGNFMNFFYNATQLIDASELVLPATTLTQACYESMFYGCTSLIGAPALPATTLADTCYFCMFRDCSSLTVAPVIPATILVTNSCSYMFSGCTNLEYIKCLATAIESTSIEFWVYGVAASGTFVKAGSMTSWPTGNSGIPSGWIVQDAA